MDCLPQNHFHSLLLEIRWIFFLKTNENFDYMCHSNCNSILLNSSRQLVLGTL